MNATLLGMARGGGGGGYTHFTNKVIDDDRKMQLFSGQLAKNSVKDRFIQKYLVTNLKESATSTGTVNVRDRKLTV